MHQGETVNLQFSSADATTAAAVGIFDADGNTRTLASNERLIVDQLQANISGSNVTKLDLFGDNDAGADVDSGERVAVFGASAGQSNRFEAGCEGYALPVGVGLSAKANAAGQVDVTGSARIIRGTTEGKRPSYRESQVPGH